MIVHKSANGCAYNTPLSPNKPGSIRIAGIKKIPCLASDRTAACLPLPSDWNSVP